MSLARVAPRFALLLALLLAPATWSCGSGTARDEGPEASVPTSAAATVPRAARGSRVPQPPAPAAPAVPSPPARDLEAEARAQEAAEREAFERAYPRHGVVYHFIAQVFAQPSDQARVVGYMRRGATFRAKLPVAGRGCPGGWHEVPGDGFVCRGNGFQIGDVPQTFEPSPVPPALEDTLPYAYAKTVRDDIPQYWSLPTGDQRAGAARVMTQLRAEDERLAALAAAAPDGGVRPAEPAEGDPPAQADSVVAPPPPGQTEDIGNADASAADALPDFLRARMLKGFYVSLDRSEVGETGTFYRTVRGGYVDSGELLMATPPSMRGVVLGGDWRLPMAFVFRGGVRRLHVDPASGALVDDGTIERHTPLVVAQDDLWRRDKRYIVSDEGVLVREPSIRLVSAFPRPPQIRATDRWVHVTLSTQVLVAYEGDTPVFATLVSTGKEGHESPTGIFQIQSKHVSTTMDDAASPDGAYSIEDVPWTMYFEGNFALHGAFWHNSFGQVRSHGCVNLAPADARWLFSWSTPTLPASWHGVFADRHRPGTWVVITE
jgi:hypothetical protein